VRVGGNTDDEIEHAARRFNQLADELDPATAQVHHTDDLREIAAASDAARPAEVRLREAVKAARAHDRSWNQIAVALGVCPDKRRGSGSLTSCARSQVPVRHRRSGLGVTHRAAPQAAQARKRSYFAVEVAAHHPTPGQEAVAARRLPRL